MNFKIYKDIFRYRHSLLCEMFARLGKEVGVSKEVEIHLHDKKHDKFLGTCCPNLEIPVIHIYIDKYKKYPCWIEDKYHPHAIRIKTELDFINFIVAHELSHLNDGHRSNFESKNGKTNMRAMEWCCDEIAAKAINARVVKYVIYWLLLFIILCSTWLVYIITELFY